MSGPLPWAWLTGAAVALAGTVVVKHRRREQERARRHSPAPPPALQTWEGEGGTVGPHAPPAAGAKPG